MKTKNLYINTMGCQMNVYDSEQMCARLKPLGYQPVGSVEKADLIIVNTCAIREKPVQKVFSFLGRLPHLKRKNPDLIIGVGGCVAQQEGSAILKRMPHVDLVFGTHTIGRLADNIRRIALKKHRIIDIEMSPDIDSTDSATPENYNRDVSRFVTIMRGCDNYCTYCVVPYVRGREISRPPHQIVDEIRYLVNTGVREVILLGQNVNSYGKKEGTVTFAQLLTQISAIEGLYRIRFTTSHPADLGDDLIASFQTDAKLCHHIHLPVQSGSDKILKRMNRKYMRSAYLKKIDKLRAVCPDIAITSDIIVGFPGETEHDFKETCNLIERVEYDGLFVFKYSDRPNAPAARFSDKIAEDEKQERLSAILTLQEHYTVKKNRALVGSEQIVLTEGFSKQHHGDDDATTQYSGRLSSNKIVNFVMRSDKRTSITNDKRPGLKGELIRVKIEKALAHSLKGVAMGFPEK
ncbi:tRNA (N6-isopentenyl adenosine(37)-C2)-methylthiotransferase MiaB [Desulfococcaceae bacterium HSG7]|nr:tRNA (N6-isopentenyl adenosine(37)-C2)-methylthiotransferase MiaB [Desulfococcaceae bacterium HSG7]